MPAPVPPDLTADSLATGLGGGFPGIPPGYVAFKGWLGPENDGLYRVFTTDDFMSFIEVRGKDIAGRVDVPSNERDSRSVFWIKRKATVIKGQVGYAYDIEGEIWGVDPGAGGNPPPKRPPW